MLLKNIKIDMRERHFYKNQEQQGMQPILIIREKNKHTRPNKLKVLAVEEAHTLIKIPVTPPGNLTTSTLKQTQKEDMRERHYYKNQEQQEM